MSDPLQSPLPWDDPGWFERVEAWVGVELERLGLEPRGKLGLVRTRPWAAIARVSTATGEVWFKEPAPAFAFEPAVTAAVSSRCPDFTPGARRPPPTRSRGSSTRSATSPTGGD